MNDYILLDSYKYATVAANWGFFSQKPNTARYTLSGKLDITYSVAIPVYWAGEIVAPVTARDTGWGTIGTLRATLSKTLGLSYTDHYGDEYIVHSVLERKERSLGPNWDDVNNKIYVEVRLIKESEGAPA